MTITVNEDIDLPGLEEDFTTPITITVAVVGENSREIRAFHPSSGVTLVSPNRFRLDSSTTTWSLELLPNDELVPTGTVYKRTITVGTRFSQEDLFAVPTTGGPYTVEELLTDAPGALTSSALTVHANAPVDNGVHGVTKHNWEEEGWASFTPLLMSVDGDQQFVTTVNDGRGRVTGTEPGDGNHRVAYVLDNARATDSEIVSLIWGPTSPWVGNNAQQGHIHRVRQISENMWEGIAFWTSVFGGTYHFIHANGVRFDGTTLGQADGVDSGFGSADSDFIDREVQIAGRERITPFGIERAVVKVVHPDRLQFIEAGDIITASNFDDAEYNETDTDVVENTLHCQLTYNNPSGVSGVDPWASVRRGFITPSGDDEMKRWTPFWLATRVIGGTASNVPVEMMRWRLGEPQPDWGDSRVQRSFITPSVSVPDLAINEGDPALWAAHFFDGSGGEWGHVEVHSLD